MPSPRWTNSSAVNGTYAFDINNSGEVVGFFYGAGNVTYGFIEDAGVYTTLSDPSAGTGSGQGTHAVAINNAGEVLGYYYDASDSYHAFVYNDGVYITLNGVATVHGFNDAGEIVGQYSSSSGDGFVAAVPELVSVAAGATLTIATVSFDSVTFEGSTGTLDLTAPAAFMGEIGGISGTGNAATSDVIDLAGFASSNTASTGSFDAATGTTLLTVYASGNAVETLTLSGDYSASTWTVSEDSSNTGIDIVDPLAPTATIAAGGNLDITSASNEIVTFAAAIGMLVLDNPESFAGQIVGFTGTAPDAAHSDVIDLVGINYDLSSFAETYNSTTGVLTITDGTHSASITFDSFNATLDFTSDGNGGTDIFDPPAIPAGEPSALSTSTSTQNSFTLDHQDDRNGHVAGDFAHADRSADHAETQSPTVSDTEAHHPAQSETQTAPASIGGPGDDHFVFNAPEDTEASHSKWTNDSGGLTPAASPSAPASIGGPANDHFVFSHAMTPP